MMINLKFDFIFFKYTLKSSYPSAGLYKMFTLILHGYTSKSLSISSLGTAGAQAHDFPHYFLCLLPSLIFSATIHPHLIRMRRRRRRREALSLKEGTKIVRITFLEYALHRCFTSRLVIIHLHIFFLSWVPSSSST